MFTSLVRDLSNAAGLLSDAFSGKALRVLYHRSKHAYFIHSHFPPQLPSTAPSAASPRGSCKCPEVIQGSPAVTVPAVDAPELDFTDHRSG